MNERQLLRARCEYECEAQANGTWVYCDYCEREGHTFRSCARRDDTGESENY